MRYSTLLLLAIAWGTEAKFATDNIKAIGSKMAFYKDVVKPAELRRRLGAHDGGEGGGDGGQEAFMKCTETCPALMKVIMVLMKEGAAMADPEVSKSPTKMR